MSEHYSLGEFRDPKFVVSTKSTSSNQTIEVRQGEDGETKYGVGPLESARGRCELCGCRLQDPGPYDPENGGGSIWLTPWHDCGGHCVVCMAHAEDPDAIAALEHWLWLTKSAQGTE